MAEDIKVGSRVLVPLFGGEVEATVLWIDRLGDQVRVTVKMYPPEDTIEEPAITSFLIERIRLATVA